MNLNIQINGKVSSKKTSKSIKSWIRYKYLSIFLLTIYYNMLNNIYLYKQRRFI